MDAREREELIRRAFSEGLTGREAFDLELEAASDEVLRRRLERKETDDRRMPLLKDALAPPEPWYRSRWLAMAASAVLAAGVVLLFERPSGDPEGLVSATVYYLDETRGARIPELAVEPDQPWLTLVLYPALDGVSEVQVSVMRLTREGSGLARAETSPVWRGRSDAGNRDSLAVNLRRSLLTPGTYRVEMHGVAPGGELVAAGRLHFRVVAAAP